MHGRGIADRQMILNLNDAARLNHRRFIRIVNDEKIILSHYSMREKKNQKEQK